MFGAESVRPNSITLHHARVEMRKRIEPAISGADAAPWYKVSELVIRSSHECDRETVIQICKTDELAKLLLLRGLLLGSLTAHFSDGIEAQDVPGWAWHGLQNSSYDWAGNSRLQLSVLLQDDWYRWSSGLAFLDRTAFAAWLDNQDLTTIIGPDDLPSPHDISLRPKDQERRAPPLKTFVSLAEALSWIAFGFSMDHERLYRALDENVFGQPDTKRAIETAINKITDLAGGGQIVVRGKFLADILANDREVLTEEINPVRFADFAEYDCLFDCLRIWPRADLEGRTSQIG
jgi:hypothetical protein